MVGDCLHPYIVSRQIRAEHMDISIYGASTKPRPVYEQIKRRIGESHMSNPNWRPNWLEQWGHRVPKSLEVRKPETELRTEKETQEFIEKPLRDRGVARAATPSVRITAESIVLPKEVLRDPEFRRRGVCPKEILREHGFWRRLFEWIKKYV